MFNLYNICLLCTFEHIHMEFAQYKCLLLILLLLLLLLNSFSSQPETKHMLNRLARSIWLYKM